MTQENHNHAENFLKEKYITATENSQFGFNEVVSILAEYSGKMEIPIVISFPNDEERRLECYVSRDKSLENTYVTGFMKGSKWMKEEILRRHKKSVL